jgi:hypothetical protein
MQESRLIMRERLELIVDAGMTTEGKPRAAAQAEDSTALLDAYSRAVTGAADKLARPPWKWITDAGRSYTDTRRSRNFSLSSLVAYKTPHTPQ